MSQQIREPEVVRRGAVADEMVEYARAKLVALVAALEVPVLDAELRLDHHADPARAGADHVEMSVDLDGRGVRARFTAPTMSEAIDGTLARLRRRVEAALDRPQSEQLRHRDLHSWHHDDRATVRVASFPRPVEDRVIVRRKTFALRPESIEEALFDLDVLDHDFFLFVHAGTGAEAVVFRTGSGYGITQRVATPELVEAVEIPLQVQSAPAEMGVQDAITVLEESGQPFVFFVDGGKGYVVYQRYDGNYGLIGS